MGIRLLAALVFLATILDPLRAAQAFSLLSDPGGGDVAETLARAGRLRPSGEPEAAVQVGIEVGFAAELGAMTPGEVALLEQAVVDAFAAWENGGLDFSIAFEDAGVAEGTGLGFEIDVFAVPATHPLFVGTAFFGRAEVSSSFLVKRALTNGQRVDGFVVDGADIYLNRDNLGALVSGFGLTQQQQLDALTRLIAHELGHVLGLGHPNSNNPFGAQTNYDTDADPFNDMVIDGADPFSALIVSAGTDDAAIMSNRPCGEPFVAPCAALFFVTLTADDSGGRDVLYPVPEPASGAMGLAALATVASLRRSRMRPA